MSSFQIQVEICEVLTLGSNIMMRIISNILRDEIMHAVLNINDERKVYIFSVLAGAHWLDLYLDGLHVQRVIVHTCKDKLLS